MRKKKTPEGNVSQERNHALSNTDERRHTQERPSEDAALALDTQRQEEPAPGKVRQPEEHATPHVAGRDDRLSTDVTPESNRDTPGDDEFAAGFRTPRGG